MEDESNDDNKKKLFILNKDGISNKSTKNIVTLTHPKSKKPSLYAISEDDLKIYEIISYKQTNKSLFIDNYNKSETVFNFLTPTDPIFLLLPFLNDKLSTGEITNHSELKLISKILTSNDFKLIKLIANIKNNNILLDEKKLKKWLNQKFSNLVDFLKTKRAESEENSEEAINKEVLSILSQYLSEDLIKKVIEIRKIDFNGNKRKSMDDAFSPISKKNKC